MPHLSSHLRATTDREGGILLDLARGQLFRCNATGALIIELLSRGADQAQIESELVRKFGLSTEKASADVQSFLAALDGQGLLDEAG